MIEGRSLLLLNEVFEDAKCLLFSISTTNVQLRSIPKTQGHHRSRICVWHEHAEIAQIIQNPNHMTLVEILTSDVVSEILRHHLTFLLWAYMVSCPLAPSCRCQILFRYYLSYWLQLPIESQFSKRPTMSTLELFRVVRTFKWIQIVTHKFFCLFDFFILILPFFIFRSVKEYVLNQELKICQLNIFNFRKNSSWLNFWSTSRYQLKKASKSQLPRCSLAGLHLTA